MFKRFFLFPWHPLLFAAYPILFFFSKNTLDFSHTVIYLPLLISLGVVIVLTGLGQLVFKSIYKAAFLTSFIIIILYTSGFIGAIFYGRFRKEHALMIAIALLVLGIVALYRIKKSFIPMTKLLNFVACVLIAGPIYTLTMRGIQMREFTTGPSFNTDFSDLKLSSSPNHPNIYYIILDAYSRDDVLKKFYNYDNEWFLKELERRGFYIANESCSNYPETIYSIPSSTNGNYIQPMMNNIVMKADPRNAYIHFLCNNSIFTCLQKIGYNVHNIDSAWISGDIIPVDELVDPLQRQKKGWFNFDYSESFTKTLLSHTVLYYIFPFLPTWNPWRNCGGLDKFNSFEQMAAYVDAQIDSLGKQRWRFSTNPHFVFCHILCPHDPFFFNKEGTVVTTGKKCADVQDERLLGKCNYEIYGEEAWIRGYADQVHALNGKILQAIDEILENSAQRPIIIIQGDHGARSYPIDHSLLAHYPILNVYLVPDEMRNLLYETISPVNSFRIIFNHLFDANLDLLPDRSYRPDSGNGAIFYDVTDEYIAEVSKL